MPEDDREQPTEADVTDREIVSDQSAPPGEAPPQDAGASAETPEPPPGPAAATVADEPGATQSTTTEPAPAVPVPETARRAEEPFPSAPAAAPAARSLAGQISGALVVAIVWATLQLHGLGNAPFHTKGEPREALVVAEIVNGGGWVLPRRNGVELPSKPPMFHWLGALTSIARGKTDEWSVRFPSAALSGAAALLVFLAGVSFWGTRAGLVAALALLTTFEWTRAATSARVDMTLTFGLTVSFIALLLLRRNDRTMWRVMFYAGMAWAILTKGPAAGAIPLLLAVVFLAVLDRSLTTVRRLQLVRGLVVVLLICGAWYLLALRDGGRQFFDKQILFENVLRAVGGSGYRGGHLHSAGRLMLELLAGLLPWALFLPVLVQWLWQSRREGPKPGARVFLLAWIAAVLLPYSLATSKRGVYLLPLYPAVCLLLGAWWEAALRDHHSFDWLGRLLRPLGWLGALIFGAAALAVGGELVGIPAVAATAGFLHGETARHVAAVAATMTTHGTILFGLFAVAAAGAVATANGAPAGRWGVAFLGLFASMAALIISVQSTILPAVAREKTRKQYAERVREIVSDPARVAAYDDFDYGFVFYWGRHVPVYRGSLSARAPEYLLIKDTAWNRLEPSERAHYEIVPEGASGRSGNVGRLLLVRRLPAEPVPEEALPGLAPPGAGPTAD